MDEFAVPGGISRQARSMPLIVLADTSTSMSGAKIASLNQALGDLIQELAADPVAGETVLLSLVTFSSQAHELCVLEPIKNVQLPVLTADGSTAMGHALRLVLAQLSDRSRLPASCAVPTIALCSDGKPNDDWEQPMKDLQAHPLASRAIRLSLAIGEDADHSVLARFINDPEIQVLYADDANKISSFFRWVTLHTKSRSVGAHTAPQPDDLLP